MDKISGELIKVARMLEAGDEVVVSKEFQDAGYKVADLAAGIATRWVDVLEAAKKMAGGIKSEGMVEFYSGLLKGGYDWGYARSLADDLQMNASQLEGFVDDKEVSGDLNDYRKMVYDIAGWVSDGVNAIMKEQDKLWDVTGIKYDAFVDAGSEKIESDWGLRVRVEGAMAAVDSLKRQFDTANGKLSDFAEKKVAASVDVKAYHPGQFEQDDGGRLMLQERNAEKDVQSGIAGLKVALDNMIELNWGDDDCEMTLEGLYDALEPYDYNYGRADKSELPVTLDEVESGLKQVRGKVVEEDYVLTDIGDFGAFQKWCAKALESVGKIRERYAKWVEISDSVKAL